ncbi:hypothetical protein PRZ48_001852 [Zasmidium cellare]|uniref:Zn(2)-C6 fungal-type domain-containing protein n=1 Tax=Zasmidium cellare TaxID=395010 RepID=A0ABR0F2F0_ZASCE|nr:hypothetical protein PRZ48_001852 [Zasmidium cellare]
MSEPPKAKRPRETARAACNRCRARKKRCDAARPSCGACLAKSLVCEYGTQDASESRGAAVRRELEELRRENRDLRHEKDLLQAQNKELLARDLQSQDAQKLIVLDQQHHQYALTRRAESSVQPSARLSGAFTMRAMSASTFSSLDLQFLHPAFAELALAFLNEAKKIWEPEKRSAGFLSVAALQLMSHTCAGNGMDILGAELMQQCLDKAQELRFYDRTSASNSTSKEHLRFESHIIWGHFLCSTMYAFYYQQRPVTRPPSLPIPGSPGFPLPAYMGQTFTSLCRLWLVIHEIMMLYTTTSDGQRINENVPLAVVEVKYQQLLTWADCLPSSDVRADVTPHHVISMHILYHAAIHFLFRPWTGKGLKLNTFDSPNSGPEAIFNASLRQLQRLVLIYRLSVSQAQYSIQWHPGLLYVSHAMLESRGPEWKFYFLLCLYGHCDLAGAFPLAALCFKGLLSMAIDQEALTVSQARYLEKQLRGRIKHLVPGPSDSGLQLELNDLKARTKPKQVDELARKFDQVAFFDDVVDFETPDPEGTSHENDLKDPILG